MSVEVDARLTGARADHDIDVSVRFDAFGINHLWIVECKLWNRAVPKERVLTLQQLATDVGAHRAFLLCEKGFQSGAVTAARLSNVTLTNLEDLHANAQADIELVRWDELYVRLAKVGEQLRSLTVVTRREDHFGVARLKPAVGEDYFAQLGTVSILQTSLERARAGQFPVICGPDDSGEDPIVAYDMTSFLDQAAKALDPVEGWAAEQIAKPWPDKPAPVDRQGRPGAPIVTFTEEDVERFLDGTLELPDAPDGPTRQPHPPA